MATNDLHTAYRPQSLEELVGHSNVADSIRSVIKAGLTHAFLFTGPSGVGKTTLARIVANMTGCVEVVEVDAATNTGVDDMRHVCSTLPYKSFGQGNKAVVVDECHRLSAAAWASMLKVLEEPPEHVYWLFCTTDAGKVPDTIRTRCVTYDLQPLLTAEIADYLTMVADAEAFPLEESAIELIAKNANGSMRRALVDLSLCAGSATTRAEVAKLLKSAEGSKEVIDLCRFLVKPQGRTWPKAMQLVQLMGDAAPESVRIIITQYFSKVAAGAKKDRDAVEALRIIEAFSQPFNPTDKQAPLLLALAEVIFRGEE